MTEKPIDLNKLDQPLPILMILTIPILGFFFIAALVFPAAGDWRWANGWVFVITFAINIAVSYMIINKTNPRVIRNRSKLRKSGLTKDTRQAASSDRFIYPLITFCLLGEVILSGLGHRFDWYTLPFAIAIIGVVIMNGGLALMNIATLQNSFASKILDINQDQVLVDTGLYSQVRHPLYAGGIIMFLSIPIALGSLWGVIPALLSAFLLVIRIEFEEVMLVKGMEGYEDYQSRVKYKLIPKIY